MARDGTDDGLTPVVREFSTRRYRPWGRRARRELDRDQPRVFQQRSPLRCQNTSVWIECGRLSTAAAFPAIHRK